MNFLKNYNCNLQKIYIHFIIELLNLSENLNTLKLNNHHEFIYKSLTSNEKIRFFTNVFVHFLKTNIIIVDFIKLVDLTNKKIYNQKKLFSIERVKTCKKTFNELVLINSFFLFRRINF